MAPSLLYRLASILAFSAISVVAFFESDVLAKSPDASTAIATPAPNDLGEMLENLGRLYSDKSNPVMQEFWLLGRYHGQQHWSDSNTG